MRSISLLLFMLIVTTLNAQRVVTVDSISYNNGYKSLFAFDDNWGIRVRVKDKPVFESKLVVSVALWNNGGRGVNISPSNFTATYINSLGKEVEVGAYEADEWRKRERRSILWFGPENTRQVTVERKSQVHDNNGNSIEENETTTSRVYTGAKDAAYERLDESLRDYLRKSTVVPQKLLSGYLILKNKKTRKLILKVNIGEVDYIFDLTKE